MAVKVAVTKNLVAVKGPQVAVVSGGSGSEGLPGSGNPGSELLEFSRYLSVPKICEILVFWFFNSACLIEKISLRCLKIFLY